MCKEGWCVRLGPEGGSLHNIGGTVWNTLKGGGIEKRGGESKILKRGKAGSRVGCIKKEGGLKPPKKLSCYTLTFSYFSYDFQEWSESGVTTLCILCHCLPF